MYGRDPYVYHNHDAVPADVVDVTIGVLRSWDMQDTDYEYVDKFHPDGVLHVGLEPSTGQAAIRSLHDEMIKPKEGPVVDLQHYVDRIFIAPKDAAANKQEVVLIGSLVNVLANGDRVGHDFASRVIMSPNDAGVLKAEHWRVYTNPMELMAAIATMQSK